LIRVLAWRRPGAIGGDPLEEPAGTRQRQKYRGPRRERTVAGGGRSHTAQNRVLAGSVEDGVAGWHETTVLVFTERAHRHHPFDQAVPHAADLPVELLDGGLRLLRPRLGSDRGQDLGQEGVGGRIVGRHDPPVLDAEVPGDGQFGEQSARQASVQVRPGAERHSALDGIESDKDELLRDQHDLSVFRTRGRGQIRLSTAATTTAVDPAVLFG
jgi:hypothetical protein